ncbi:MAG: cupin domain-containing protein [Natrialbaceae archaeon]|nr:cupin domain-containing protein [Natrialbaceae archaeon]
MVEPLVIHEGDRSPDAVPAGEGLAKTVLIDGHDGAETGALRRFTLEPGGTVPRHTNAVEHLQYVLAGEYTVGLEDTEYTVEAGDAVFVPAETVHWYHNPGPAQGAFLCVVPPGEDEIQLRE